MFETPLSKCPSEDHRFDSVSGIHLLIHGSVFTRDRPELHTGAEQTHRLRCMPSPSWDRKLMLQQENTWVAKINPALQGQHRRPQRRPSLQAGFLVVAGWIPPGRDLGSMLLLHKQTMRERDAAYDSPTSEEEPPIQHPANFPYGLIGQKWVTSPPNPTRGRLLESHLAHSVRATPKVGSQNAGLTLCGLPFLRNSNMWVDTDTLRAHAVRLPARLRRGSPSDPTH